MCLLRYNEDHRGDKRWSGVSNSLPDMAYELGNDVLQLSFLDADFDYLDLVVHHGRVRG